MGETVEAIGYKADVPARFGDAVRDRIETVRGTVSDAVASVSGTVADGTSRAGDQVRDAAGSAAGGAKRAVSIAAENPIGVALGALALGFLGGLLIPVSDVERERVGPVRDLVVDRAKTAVGEAIDAGQAVLSDTIAAATSSAQQHAQTVVQHAVAGTPFEGDAPATHES